MAVVAYRSGAGQRPARTVFGPAPGPHGVPAARDAARAGGSAAAALRRAPRRAAPRRAPVTVAIVLAFALGMVAGIAAPRAFGAGPGRNRGTTGAAALGAHEAAGATYVVRPGDTLWAIARRIQPAGDVRPLVARLARANGGPAIVPGQRLVLAP